jgi:branched-chain amino acid transport system substrate-binding protein
MIRRFASALLALAASASLTLPARAADPYEINAVMSLTGPGAFLGQSEATTLRAQEELINKSGGIKGRPVRFVIQDDQSNPQVAVQLTTALIAKHVPVILGPTYSATCYAVLPLTVKNGPVQYCFAPSIHPPAGSYEFSAGVSTKDLAAAGIRYFRERGWKRVALLVTTDATGQDGENVVKEDLASAENRDMSLVATEHFKPTDLSINAQLTRIKASGAQAVVAWVTGTPFGTVLHGIADTGLEMPILTNAGNINNAQMAQYESFLPKQLLFTGFLFLGHDQVGPGPVRNVQTEFLDAMRARGIKPDVTYAFAWDPAAIVVEALRHVGPNATAKQIHDYIESRQNFPGINGLLDFRDGSQRGLNAKAALIVRYDPGTKAWVPVSKPTGIPL